MSAFAGHYWTLAPSITGEAHAWLIGSRRLRGQLVVAPFVEPRQGEVQVAGTLNACPGDELLVLVHGMGGTPESFYVLDAARTAQAQGVSALRVALRGATANTRGLYNAGVAQDLVEILRAPALARFGRIYICGFSLGGHVTLRHAAAPSDPRVVAYAAVSPPLDLGKTARSIDRVTPLYARVLVGASVPAYRRYYERLSQERRAGLITPKAARGLRTVCGWDDAITAPVMGYPSAQAYHDGESVAPRLGSITTPTLIVSTQHDPIVRHDTVEAAHANLSASTTLRVVPRGGHVGMPKSVDLGYADRPGLSAQLLGWLRSRS